MIRLSFPGQCPEMYCPALPGGMLPGHTVMLSYGQGFHAAVKSVMGILDMLHGIKTTRASCTGWGAFRAPLEVTTSAPADAMKHLKITAYADFRWQFRSN